MVVCVVCVFVCFCVCVCLHVACWCCLVFLEFMFTCSLAEIQKDVKPLFLDNNAVAALHRINGSA